MKKRLCVLVLLAVFICSAFPLLGTDGTAYAAAKPRTMKTYGSIKSGNLVYGIGSSGIYKVNIKTKKVRRLVKLLENDWISTNSLAKKGNYLYYIGGGPASSSLYRVNINNAKRKCLFSGVGGVNDREVVGYIIYKNKIYVHYLDRNFKHKYTIMNLNGTSKKQTKVIVKNKGVRTNNKSYYVYSTEKNKGGHCYSYDYLKAAKRRIYLGKIRYY